MDINKKIDIFFNKIDCPICKSQIQTHYKTHDVPYFGEIIFLTLICQNCGYKRNDLFNVYEKEPRRYIFKINEEKDLKIKVVRSSSCTIKIPEFGTIIEPGAEPEGYITNIEGMLLRVNDVLITLEKDSQDEETLNKIQELKNRLKKAMEGKLEFTLILEDPNGNSAIISEDNSKLKVERL